MRARLPTLVREQNIEKMRALLSKAMRGSSPRRASEGSPESLIRIAGAAEERLTRALGNDPGAFKGAVVEASFPFVCRTQGWPSFAAGDVSHWAVQVEMVRRGRGWCLVSADRRPTPVETHARWNLQVTEKQAHKISYSAAVEAGVMLPLGGSSFDPTMIAAVTLLALHFNEITDEIPVDRRDELFEHLGISRDAGRFALSTMVELLGRSGHTPESIANDSITHGTTQDFLEAARDMEAGVW